MEAPTMPAPTITMFFSAGAGTEVMMDRRRMVTEGKEGDGKVGWVSRRREGRSSPPRGRFVEAGDVSSVYRPTSH